MESRAKLLGHPVHQMLIVFPLGLLATSLGFDIAYLASSNGRWADISYWMIAVGVVSGLVAGIFGLVDWLAIPPKTRAKKIGAYHAVGNVIVLGLFLVSWFLRRDIPQSPEHSAIFLSVAGVVIALVTGWLGGELVDRLGVGVDDNAHLNAPNSLHDDKISHRPSYGRPAARGV